MLPKSKLSVITATVAGISFACTVISVAPSMASDFEVKREEMRRRFEQRKAEMQNKWGARGASSVVSGQSGVTTYGGNWHSSQPYNALSSKGYTSKPYAGRSPGTTAAGYGNSSRSSAIPFNASSAPSPDLCFLKFVVTAKSATTADAILGYLPEQEARVLQDRQKLYDPHQAAEHRASFQQRNPKLTPDQLDHLTEPPFTGELKHCKRIAAKVIRVKSFKITGNTAKLIVSTHSNLVSSAYGKPMNFPYSTATVEMIGEGNYWKFKSYNDSAISYTKEQ